MGGFNDGASDSASNRKDGKGDVGTLDNERSGSSGDNLNDSRLGGSPAGGHRGQSSVGDGRNGESRGANSSESRVVNRAQNGENSGENSESPGENGENHEVPNEPGGEGGEGGGENPPPDCDPVRDEEKPRPSRRNDHDNIEFIWPIPIDNPGSKISASGGYNTQIRPGGSSSVDEPIVSATGGSNGSAIPVLSIGP